MNRLEFLETRFWIISQVLKMLPHEIEKMISFMQKEIWVEDED